MGVDFAICLREIAEALPTVDEDKFEFTESDAALRFKLDDGKVFVSSNYAEGPIATEVDYREIREAANDFLRRVVDELSNVHPDLRKNPAIARLDRQ